MATATATVQTAPQPSSIYTRPLRGSRISTFYPVKKSTTLPLLNSLNSAFQLQEYISLVIRQDVHDVERIVSLPSGNGAGSAKGKEKEEDTKDEKEGEQESAESKEKQPEVSVDEACWKYEQLRRLAQDLSHPLITSLQQVCTRATCPEMKAGEWLYLCVAHGNDGAMEQCCAIDYILHTLDSATALLNSPRAFPSRLQIEPSSHRHFSSLARRLGRIFAHAYFHHREEFEQAEAESSLYARFLALTEKFDLVPADFLVIPPRVGEGNANNGNNDDRRGNLGGPAGAAEVPEPTLLGASLQVTTQEPTHLESGSGSGGSSPDSVLSPGGTGTRRFGRSRTDTMMLEGEGRFPASPLSAAEDGPRLDSVLALAEAELGATTQTHPEEHQTHEQPAELDIEQDDDHDEEEDKSAEDAHSFIAAGLPAHDPELEPESPPGDGSTGTGLAPEPPSPQGDVMPVVTPSSSTSTAALPLVLPAKEPIEVIQVNSDGEDDGEVKEEKAEEAIMEAQSVDVPASAEKDLTTTETEAVAGVVPPAEVEVETAEKVEQPAVEQVVATPEPAPVGENVQEADVTEEKAE
uniref:Mob1/phocein n=1 Tax=Mycena chlorophos TaxID=658473 RepID=A0ABQ0LCW8_MYCCL|nr:predicted protein [Mycena chlorophos]